MPDCDLVIKGSTVVTAADMIRADIAIRGETIATIGTGLSGAWTIDAAGLLVLPGGVDSHCHIEQLQHGGGADEESWTTGSTSALAGGTTSVITFSTQFKGGGILEPFAEYRRRAAKAMVDHSFHQIITDATDTVVFDEIPRIVAAGVRSLKCFLTYDPLHLDDRQFLRVLAAARRNQAFVTVHCENYEAIRWRTAALLADGRLAPKYHALVPPRCRRARGHPPRHRPRGTRGPADPGLPRLLPRGRRGDRPRPIPRPEGLGRDLPAVPGPDRGAHGPAGLRGREVHVQPHPRDAAAAEGLWRCIDAGTLDIVSSDHSGWSYATPADKCVNGPDAPFRDIPNGVPGLAARLPVLFSEGVGKGRIDPTQFVRLTAYNPARLFGLYPRKGTIAPGSDADLVLWDPAKKQTITNALMQHVIDYTPYEGLEVTGWPVATFRRGQAVMRDGAVQAAPGSGRFLPRGPYAMIRPTRNLPDGFDASAFQV